MRVNWCLFTAVNSNFPGSLFYPIRVETLDQAAVERYRTLLEVSESIALHRDLAALFHDLGQRLHRVVPFDFLSLVLPDPERNVMRLHVLETPLSDTVAVGYESAMGESPGGLVWQTQEPLVVDDLAQETRFPAVSEMLRGHGVRSICTLPLTTAQRRVGSMGLGSVEKAAYGEADLEFLQHVARQVAVAVDNALNYQDSQLYHQQLSRERDRLSVLLEVTNALVTNLDAPELFRSITTCLRRVIPHEFASIALHDAANNQLRVYALDFPTGQGLLREEMTVPAEAAPAGCPITSRQPVLLGPGELHRFPSEIAHALEAEEMKTVCCVPLITHNRVLGTLNVATRRENAFSQADVDLLSQVAAQIAIAVENALAFRQIGELKDKLAEEKLYLEGEIRTEHNFEEIVGESAALKRILKEVETVAPADATVLILGETGTGKELIARAIHSLSPRRDRTFVKLNCAAIPTGLLESELFGHEKGAFTGAIAQKIGRLELAHQGTLFLDEVGDIPLELQPKLLRALHEKEFERLGSTRTIHVDVRLVAATNRDLAQMVNDRQFRADLFYRLNVFPISMPSLRERPEDIPVLVRYFAQEISRRMNRAIETIPAETMNALSRYHWPGNVRELENLIERAVILSPGSVLNVPLAELKRSSETEAGTTTGGATTLADAEREHILRILGETNWIVGGPHGAAARLGMKRTTLQSKMRKLEIARPTA